MFLLQKWPHRLLLLLKSKVTPVGVRFSLKFWLLCTDPGPKEKRRILPELTPVIRIRSHLWYSPELNTIRFPDRDPTGFCNSEPDLDWISQKLNRIGYGYPNCIDHCMLNAYSEFFFGYKPDWIKYLDRSTGLG